MDKDKPDYGITNININVNSIGDLWRDHIKTGLNSVLSSVFDFIFSEYYKRKYNVDDD